MKLRKELWFGFSLMAAILIPVIVLMPWGHLTNGHLGLMMLALICVGIMLGFPTAFTLMGMGVFFAWLAYRSVDPATANRQVLDLRSEEHTSELQSLTNLVCRLLLEKKKTINIPTTSKAAMTPAYLHS